jgi:hypothetical protein
MSETDTAGAAIRAKRLKHLPVKLHHFLERREEGFQAVMLGVQMFTVRQGRDNATDVKATHIALYDILQK